MNTISAQPNVPGSQTIGRPVNPNPQSPTATPGMPTPNQPAPQNPILPTATQNIIQPDPQITDQQSGNQDLGNVQPVSTQNYAEPQTIPVNYTAPTEPQPSSYPAATEGAISNTAALGKETGNEISTISPTAQETINVEPVTEIKKPTETLPAETQTHMSQPQDMPQVKVEVKPEINLNQQKQQTSTIVDMRTGHEALHGVDVNADELTADADKDEADFIEEVQKHHGSG